MVVYLDTERPLSEPKWARSGDVQEWLKSMFGRMFWVAGAAAEGWEKKIQVVDPDPVSAFFHLKPSLFHTDKFYYSRQLYGLYWRDGPSTPPLE
jgi:hypothetical protein